MLGIGMLLCGRGPKSWIFVIVARIDVMIILEYGGYVRKFSHIMYNLDRNCISFHKTDQRRGSPKRGQHGSISKGIFNKHVIPKLFEKKIQRFAF